MRKEGRTRLGLAGPFWGELQSSNFWMEFGGNKMDPKGFGFTGNGRALWEAKGKGNDHHMMAQKSIPPIITQSVSLLLYIAYLPVHSRANFVYFSRSVLYTRAEKIFYSQVPFKAIPKVHFRANVMAYIYTLARKWTFGGAFWNVILPISGTRGSSGFGSVRREQIESKTLLIVNAGDHCDLESYYISVPVGDPSWK